MKVTKYCDILHVISVIVLLHINNVDTRLRRQNKKFSMITVTTKQGQITGTVVKGKKHGMNTYTRFLGVPYAMPPVGDLRFKDPITGIHPGWPIGSTWNATTYKPACPQDLNKLDTHVRYPGVRYVTDDDNRLFNDVRTDEDCLYLNIYIPQNLSQVQHVNTLQLPVMIFIHGDGFQTEVARLHEGWRLANHGDVIICTLDYRVGAFGFLTVLDTSAPGNVGLKDQRAAMHWIWDNIREFGGDPERVTIFGASAGGVSVGLHMLSPLSRGVFNRAISQSGVSLSPGMLQLDPSARARELAESVRCPVNPTANMLACLRKVPTYRLVQVSSQLGGWLPVIDGRFLPTDPLSLLRQGRFNPVDYIIGVNVHDGYNEAYRKFHVDLHTGISQDDLEDIIDKYLTRYHKNYNDRLRSAVLLEYSFCVQNKSQLARSVVDFLTEYQYLAPADMVARLMTKDGQRTIYFYEFAHRPSYAPTMRPWSVLSDHGDEVDFVFGTLPNGSHSEQIFSEALMNAWTNFARNGNPNPVVPGLFWQPYEQVNRKYVELTSDLTGKSAKSGLRQRRSVFWNEYVPFLHDDSSCTERDHCERPTRPLRLQQERTSIALWAIIALLGVLLMLVVVLAAKIWLPKDIWKKCSPRPKTTKTEPQTEAERKKLHPLPYYEETT